MDTGHPNDLILSSLSLPRPCFQIRSHSQVPGSENSSRSGGGGRAQFSPSHLPSQKHSLSTFPLGFALIKARDGGNLYSGSDGGTRTIWGGLRCWRGKIDEIGLLRDGQRKKRALGNIAPRWMAGLTICAGDQKEKQFRVGWRGQRSTCGFLFCQETS